MGAIIAHPIAGFVELVPLVITGVDLTAFVVALMIVLVVIAGWVILYIIHITLGRISIFGFHPFDLFYNSAQETIKGLWGYMATRVPALAHFLWSLVMIVWRPLYVIGATVAGLLTQIVGVSQASQKGLANLQAREDFFIGVLRNQEQTDIANLGLSVLSIEAQLQAKEAADIAAVNGTITRDVNNVNTRITNDVNSLTNQINGVRTGLTNTINADVTTLNNRITTTNNTTNARITTDVNSLTNQIATARTVAENFALAHITSAIPGIVAQAKAAVQPEIDKINTDINDCLDPLCDTVTPQAKRLGNLGKWFQDLELLGVAALLVAIAEEARTDPGGVAHDIEAVVQGVGSDVFQGFRDIIGL